MIGRKKGSFQSQQKFLWDEALFMLGWRHAVGGF
jgi:hypothetical protein